MNSLAPQRDGRNAGMVRGTEVASADDGVVQENGMLTRKQAVDFLGMNDTEFALRLIWDAEFPKAEGGSFRAADVVAWMRAWRAGTHRAPARQR